MAVFEPGSVRQFYLGPLTRDSTYSDGVVSGATFGVTGPFTDSNASEFDGTNDFITLGDDAKWSIGHTGSLSVEAWVWFDTVAGNRFILSKTEWAGVGDEYELFNGGGQIYWQLKNQAGGTFLSAKKASVVVANTWYHIVGTYDGTTARLYLDGVEIASDSTEVGDLQDSGTVPVFLGSNGTPGVFLDGKQAETAIYGTALSPSKVAAHYAARTNKTTYRAAVNQDSPAGYWALRESSGRTAFNDRTWNTYLVRDDAVSKQGAHFGRTVRLGDPINLGPNSAWRQKTWVGGVSQKVWNDEEMFESGTADTRSRAGRLTMHNGWEGMLKETNRVVRKFLYLPWAADDNRKESIKILIAETRKAHYFQYVPPPGGFRIFALDVETGGVNVLGGGPNLKPQAITNLLSAGVEDTSGKGITWVGTETSLWHLTAQSRWVEDTGAKGMNPETLVGFGDNLYFGFGSAFMKRTPKPPYGVIGTHTEVKKHIGSTRITNMVTWNNRIWYLLQTPRKCSVYTSDGNTTQLAFDIPNEFYAESMAVHYGVLYMGGQRPGFGNADLGSAQVWRFTGNALTLLWEGGDVETNEVRGVNGMISHNESLLWTVNGVRSDITNTDPSIFHTPRTVIMGYDPVTDTIFEGPGLEVPQGLSGYIETTSLGSAGGVLYASFLARLPRAHVICRLRSDRKVRNDFTTNTDYDGDHYEALDDPQYVRREFIKSSQYYGEHDVSAEDKVWLNGRMPVTIPQHTRVRLSLFLNGSDDEVPIKTLDYNGSTEQRTENIPLRPNQLAREILIDKAVGYWPLSEPQGTAGAADHAQNVVARFGAAASNVTLNPKNGTYINAPTAVTGALVHGDPTGRKFDGSTEYVEVVSQGNGDSPLSITGGIYSNDTISVEAWVKVDANDASSRGLVTKAASSKHEWQLMIRTDNKLRFQLLQADGSNYAVADDGTVFSTGVWHHVVGTWDNTTIKLYVDGVEVATSTSTTGSLGGFSTAPLNIGRRGLGDYYFDGSIDEVAVYESTLSPARILAHYNAGISSPDYLRSNSVQYKLYLENIDSSLTSTARPDIDAFELEWQPVPRKQRTWRYVVVVGDDDLRLDDSPNTVTTSKAQSDKLEDGWAAHLPQLLWEASADEELPDPSATPGIEVLTTEYLDQSFRVVQPGTSIARYVSLTFTENVGSL